MTETADTDTRYRSRKWRLACWVEAWATLAASVLLAVIAAHDGDYMPVLWWWTATSGAVLTGYGFSNVGDTFAGKMG